MTFMWVLFECLRRITHRERELSKREVEGQDFLTCQCKLWLFSSQFNAPGNGRPLGAKIECLEFSQCEPGNVFCPLRKQWNLLPRGAISHIICHVRPTKHEPKNVLQQIDAITMPNCCAFLSIGAPQVLRYSVAKEVEAISGRDVRLEMDVCSDPVPSRTTWDWGTHRVDAGQVCGICGTKRAYSKLNFFLMFRTFMEDI